MGVGLAIQGVCTQRKNEARSGARNAWVASLVPEAPPAAVTSSKPKLAASAAGVRSCLTSLSATYISM